MLERFIEWMRVQNYAKTTIESRYKQIAMFIRWCEERQLLEPREIAFNHLERYQIWCNNYRKANSKYLGIETQAQTMAGLKVFFRYLLKHKHISIDPSAEIELPKVVKKLPSNILNIEEVEKILAQANLSTLKGMRDRAIMEVFYSTGVRRGELGNLLVNDLDKERGVIWIRQGKGSKDRVVPIGERAIAYLELYLEKARPLLANKGKDEAKMFINKDGEAFRLEGIANIMKQYMKAAGIDKAGSCHIFRHTCATLMLEAGADIRYIQEMLGHNSLATTQIYTKVFDRKLKEVHSRTHPSAKLLKPILEDTVKSSDEETKEQDTTEQE
jgi:integrase/recombinase XerD